MRKRFLLLFWCLLLVVSCSEAMPPGRGTPGVRPKQITVTDRAGNPITLYKESHALLIGASAYQHWPQLRGVLTDVTAVQAALEQQGFTVTTVLDPDRVTLLAAFENFINQYGLDEQDNRLLIYFAGHGYTTKKTMGEMGYIVPVDAPNPTNDLRGFLRFGVDMAQIEVYAKRIDSKHALFVFDSCFSGSVFVLSGRGIPPVITYNTAKPVRQFITSGSADEEVPDVSMFRKQFVSGLAGEADTDRDGYITGKELGMFLATSVINYSNNTQHPQFGTLRNPELDKGDFVFQVVAVEPPPQPVTPMPPSPSEITFSIADLEAQEEAERASRSKWGQSQVNMQAAFDKTAAFVGRAEFQREAWARFLTAYAQNNPYSTEDERLRQEATRRQAAVRDEPERKEFEPEMVAIPAGSFEMGSPSDEAGRSGDEGPVHTVHIDAFQMGKYEVTNAQFRKFRPEHNSGEYSGHSLNDDNQPVVNVSWEDAVAYTEWLAKETGKPYRLPTEAEWEYAARAGTTKARFWGDNPDQACSYANVHDRTSKQQFNFSWTHHDCNDSYAVSAPVGSYSPNPWGLYDMLGNVWEWNQDKWHGNYAGAPTDGRAWEAGDSSGRLLRGCSWGFYPDDCRAANRYNNTNPFNVIGFRVVFLVAGRAD